MGAVAKQAEVNSTQIYRTLSEGGNPSLNTMVAILKSMNLRLSVQPLKLQTR